MTVTDDQAVLYSEGYYYFMCPHCSVMICVAKNELNCKIFRCGNFKSTGDQIPPHASEKMCVMFKEKDLVNGCAKPFIFDGHKVEICGYI
jgi:hypothetical protein